MRSINWSAIRVLFFAEGGLFLVLLSLWLIEYFYGTDYDTFLSAMKELVVAYCIIVVLGGFVVRLLEGPFTHPKETSAEFGYRSSLHYSMYPLTSHIENVLRNKLKKAGPQYCQRCHMELDLMKSLFCPRCGKEWDGVWRNQYFPQKEYILEVEV